MKRYVGQTGWPSYVIAEAGPSKRGGSGRTLQPKWLADVAVVNAEVALVVRVVAERPVVGIAAVAALSLNSRLTHVTVLVIAVSVLTQVVYPWSATQLVEGGIVTIFVQSARIILLVTATVLSVRAIATAPKGQTV